MGTVAVVTGGASGIGLALSRALVRRGGDVLIVDRDADRLATAAATLDAEGPGTARSTPVDVTDAAALHDVVASAHERCGRLDLMVNNAGISITGEPDELTLDHWDRAIDVNLRGVVNGCHAAYPRMRQQGFGRIVNVASLAGLTPGFGTAVAYNTTKYAVVGLSLSLRAAGADAGVGVHVVCPGVVDTPILDSPPEPDLPTPPSVAGVDMRRLLRDTRLNRPYPPDRLAADVLRGMARNRAIIVVPRQAQLSWLLTRVSPRLADRLALHGTRMARRHAAAAERRAG